MQYWSYTSAVKYHHHLVFFHGIKSTPSILAEKMKCNSEAMTLLPEALVISVQKAHFVVVVDLAVLC